MVVSKKPSQLTRANIEKPDAGVRRLTQEMGAIRLELRQLRDRLEVQNRKIDDLIKSVGFGDSKDLQRLKSKRRAIASSARWQFLLKDVAAR